MLCAWMGACSFSAVALADNAEVFGQLRGYWIGRQSADTGPLGQANALEPGTAAIDASAAGVQAELRASGHVGAVQVQASATLQAQKMEGTDGETQSRFNEAYAAGSMWGWQWSAGKKVVSWDVGYGLRPNDVVQQEVRRTLAPEALEGRPLLMAEHFGADTAWSLVWVNPTQERSDTGAHEAALATRVYWHSGAVDWHGFARKGETTGSSVGAAASWVASDALELHASVRSNQQALIGGTWTGANQISLLMEAWHDGTALSDGQWSDWTARNQTLPLWLARGIPVAAVAGNLALQGKAFGVSNSLRQDNLFARLSWQHERWQAAADVLYTPTDRGLISTASLLWTGERFKLEMGLRNHGGPQEAVVRQLPVQRQAYAVWTWTL